ACTAGAVGKCEIWGFDPQLGPINGFNGAVSGPDRLSACVRMARADYCGGGFSHTRSGAGVIIWSTLAAAAKAIPPGFHFEAAWMPDAAPSIEFPVDGAMCLHALRWSSMPLGSECSTYLKDPRPLAGGVFCEETGHNAPLGSERTPSVAALV